MADNVRYILDKLAVLFHRLEEIKLFNTDEIKALITKITNYEYTLKRRQLQFTDYQNYLHYMINFDKLVIIRYDKLLSIVKNKVEMEAIYKVIESLIQTHIIYIFDRSVRRFSNEVSLWNDYFAYLQNKEANAVLNIIFGKALSLFPKNVEFWIQASIHELQANSNVHSARITLQRGLRVNKSNAKLWIRYFELELWNVMRTNEREVGLGLNEDEELIQGAPMVVFKHAIESINDLDCILDMYETCITLATSLVPLMREILVSKFGTNSKLWKYFCQQNVDKILLPNNLETLSNEVYNIDQVTSTIASIVTIISSECKNAFITTTNTTSTSLVTSDNDYVITSLSCLKDMLIRMNPILGIYIAI